MLAVLTEKIKLSKGLLDAQAIGNALYGLQGMSSDSKEVRGMLVVLTEKMKLSKELLNAQEIGNALYGLQGMSSEVKEVLC